MTTNPILKIAVVTTLVLSGTYSIKVSAQNTASGGCAAKEEKAFSCSIGKKRLSLCTEISSNLVTYRFGKKGEPPELKISSPISPEGAISISSSTVVINREHSELYEITIVNKDTAYVLNIFELPSDERAVLTILPPKTKPIVLACKAGTESVDINKLESMKKGK